MELICYLNEIFMHWDFIGWKYNWTLKLNWHQNIKRSQAKPNQPGMEWSQSWNAHCISYPRSRSMGPSVQNCYCFPWTFPILTDDSCLLSTRDKGTRAHQIFLKNENEEVLNEFKFSCLHPRNMGPSVLNWDSSFWCFMEYIPSKITKQISCCVH